MAKKTIKSEFTNPFCAEAIGNTSIMYSGNTDNISKSDHMIIPQKCGFWTKAACVGAFTACGAICWASVGTACAACLGAIGSTKCLKCFTG